VIFPLRFQLSHDGPLFSWRFPRRSIKFKEFFFFLPSDDRLVVRAKVVQNRGAGGRNQDEILRVLRFPKPQHRENTEDLSGLWVEFFLATKDTEALPAREETSAPQQGPRN
jgi:hypothetical protein